MKVFSLSYFLPTSPYNIWIHYVTHSLQITCEMHDFNNLTYVDIWQIKI